MKYWYHLSLNSNLIIILYCLELILFQELSFEGITLNVHMLSA